MIVIETQLPGVLLLEPMVFSDKRELFLERFSDDCYRELAIDQSFVQDDRSRSVKGVPRGLHFQKRTPQAKHVEVVRGAVPHVVVDVRPDSATFGKWYGVELSDRNHYQLWIPVGVAHSFCTLSDQADFFYTCTSVYDPDDEGGIAWNDPELEIAWPADAPILSATDVNLLFFSSLEEKDLPHLVQFVAQ